MTRDNDVAAAAASNGGLYLYEFLYRGRAPGAALAADYHVILAQDVTDAFGGTSTSTSPAMTPAQAASLGFALPRIVAAIDASTMAENADLKARAVELQAKLDAAQAELAALRVERDPLPLPMDTAPADAAPAG